MLQVFQEKLSARVTPDLAISCQDMTAVGRRALRRLVVQESALCQPLVVGLGLRCDLIQDRRDTALMVSHFHANGVAAILHNSNLSCSELRSKVPFIKGLLITASGTSIRTDIAERFGSMPKRARSELGIAQTWELPLPTPPL
jgi:hypothetical protein